MLDCYLSGATSKPVCRKVVSKYRARKEGLFNSAETPFKFNLFNLVSCQPTNNCGGFEALRETVFT